VSSSWETFNPEDKFAGTSLKKRALKRTVEQMGPRAWRVLGSTKLSDAYPEYIITLPDDATKYNCTCYGHGMGDVRRRKMCSHVLAVILYRKDNPEYIEERQSLEPVGEADQRIEAASLTGERIPDEPPHVTVSIEPEEAAARREGAAGRYRSVGAGTLDPNEIPLPSDPVFGQPPIPDKFSEFRPNQWAAATEILGHLEAGVKVVMLSAPTGSGKTIIGEAVRRLWPGRHVYTCTTKSLQDQIQRDFPYAKTIKGRSNYRTQYRRDLTADDCTGTANNGYECEWCDTRDSCPYRIAKEVAVNAPLPVLNAAYYLHETATKRGSGFINRDLVIIDEADTIEEQLMGYVEVVIGPRLRKSLEVYSLPKKTVPEDWIAWLDNEIMPAIVNRQAALRVQARTLLGVDTQKMRQVKSLERLRGKVRDITRTDWTGEAAIAEGWVMTGYEGSKDSEATVRFKPVKIDEYARAELWDRGHQFLLMSATLISPEQMAEDLGLEEDEWAVVHLDSTFPVENRPVFIDDVAPVTNKTKERAWPLVAEKLGKVIDENPGVRILVHTVSYAFTKYLQDTVYVDTRDNDSIMSYRTARDREMVLEDFLADDEAVLLAPSFERGIDLPEEDCQVIVICKVPYPYLGDKQISARLRGRGGEQWYAVQTIRTIAQMTGRGMRSAEDWCDTYILDSSFKRLFRDNKRLFPKWWKEALVLSRTDPKYKPLIRAAAERKDSRNG
jgi:ATP-dependent DNA helicase DinG